MPSSCFVPGCKGNYYGSVRVGSYRIPRDELIRKKWVEVLHRKESDISKHSRVSMVLHNRVTILLK